MTITHVSHFGLTLIGETNDGLTFEGTLAGCRQMAFAHGMEVDRYEGQTIAFDAAGAINAPGDAKNFTWCFFKGRGFILKTQNGYALQMPREVWVNQ